MVKSIGLGFKTPLDAKDGVYIDKKCPWTGTVSIRGKLLRGTVVSTKMKRLVLHSEYALFSSDVALLFFPLGDSPNTRVS